MYMYPTSLQLVSYNGMYLGTQKSIFGFVKPAHANYVSRNMKYENMSIMKTDNCFIMTPSMLKKPLNKKLLNIVTYDTDVGHYFTKINNMNMKIIDSVSHNKKEDSFILHSNYTINFEVDDEMQAYHLDLLFKETSIDYSEEYNNMLLLSFLEGEEQE